MKKLFVFVLLLFIATPALALTPVAQTDVVPYQYIEAGTTFKYGVVAFSKAGIDDIECVIAGQGYDSGNKTASAMTMNTRHAHTPDTDISGWTGWPGVAEYVIEVPSSEFDTDGPITFNCTVTGDDAGTRVLDEVTLYVDVAPARTVHYCYADSVAGDDGTCDANDSESPCATISAAAAKAETANGGEGGDTIVYLEEGTYSLASLDPVTTNKWLTIKNAPGADRDNIIIDGGDFTDADYIKFDGVTLYTDDRTTEVIQGEAVIVWIHNSKVTSSDRYASAGQTEPGNYPVIGADYVTNSYFYNIDRGFGSAFARNVTLYKIAEDAGRNGEFAVNIRVNDQDNGTRADCSSGEADEQWGNIVTTYTHDGGNNEATFSDGDAGLTVDLYIGNKIWNTTDGSTCTITDNDGSTVTCSLGGGTDNDWDDGDVAYIGRAPFHADTYQNFNRAADQQILYNWYATDLHYQGIFLRNTSLKKTDVTDVSFADANPDTITKSGGGLGNMVVGQPIVVTGDSDNNGTYTIAGVTDTVITLDGADELSTEAAGDTVTLENRHPTNNAAYVNIFVEQRTGEANRGTTACSASETSGAIYPEDNAWNHVLLWHNTYVYEKFSLNGLDVAPNDVNDFSIIGSYFWEFREPNGVTSEDPPEFANGNAFDNEALYNAYSRSNVDGEEDYCVGGVEVGCGYHADTPDSGDPATQVLEADPLDQTDTTTYVNFGLPKVGSSLIDALPSNLTGVLYDALGNERDATPDIGALERDQSGKQVTLTGGSQTINTTGGSQTLSW